MTAEGEDALAVDRTGQSLDDRSELQRATTILGVSLIEKYKAQRLEVAKERCAKEVNSIRSMYRERTTDMISPRPQRSAANEADVELAGDECPICMDNVEEKEDGGIITKCGHIFCKSCVLEVIAKDMADDNENDARGIRYKPDERPCPK